MSNELMRKEVNEAIQAAERALVCLREAKEQLRKARNWGYADLLGGGFLINMMKRSRMADASRCMEEAKHALAVLQMELRDVQVPMDMRLEINGFMDFADFFFDGLIADWFAQDKINKAAHQVDDAIRRVEDIRTDLKGLNFYY